MKSFRYTMYNFCTFLVWPMIISLSLPQKNLETAILNLWMKPILVFASWLSAVHPLLKTGPKLWGRPSLSILWRLLCCWLDGGPHSGVKFNLHMMASIALWKCMMASMSIKKTILDFSAGLLVGRPHSGIGFYTWWQQCPLKMYTMTTMSVSNKPILDFSAWTGQPHWCGGLDGYKI